MFYILALLFCYDYAFYTYKKVSLNDEFYKIKGIKPVRAQHIQNPNKQQDKELLSTTTDMNIAEERYADANIQIIKITN